MNHILLMKNHITGIIITHHPPQLPASSYPPKLLGVVRQDSMSHHILVERIDSFLGAQRLRVTRELGFQLLAERTAVFEVHQAAARRRTVTDRYPRGEELGVAAPQEYFVVMDAGAEAAGAVMTQDGAVY